MAGTDGTRLSLSNDAALADRARKGDDAAFAELWRRHGTPCWRTAHAIVADETRAGDAVVDAFTAALTARPSSPQSFGLTTMIATRHAALDRRDLRLEADRAVAESTDPVRAAFDQLTERHRSVLWLHEVEALTTAETALVLGLTPDSTERLARRAQAGLREHHARHYARTAGSRPCRRTAGRLGSFIADDLNDRDVPVLEAHLAECDECRAELKELTHLPSRLSTLAPALPTAVGHRARDAWAASVGASRRHDQILALPVVGRINPVAQRALAGAAALLVGAGILSATMFGARESSKTEPELGFRQNTSQATPDHLTDPDLDLSSSGAGEVRVKIPQSTFGSSGGADSGSGGAAQVIGAGPGEAATGTSVVIVPKTPTVPEQPGDGPGDNSTPPSPVPPVGSGEVKAKVGGSVGGTGGAISIDEECPGVTVGDTSVGCETEPPADDGLEVEVTTPVGDPIMVGLP